MKTPEQSVSSLQEPPPLIRKSKFEDSGDSLLDQYDPEKMEKMMMSPIKREQLRKAEKAEIKQRMRENLPVYTMNEIRRYRMPLHEAIEIEMDELQLTNAASFLRQLINYQEEMRRSNGPESKVWSKPRIIDRSDVLTNLSNCFKAAETAHKNNEFNVELDEFLHLGVLYTFRVRNDNWWWLGEQLLLQCNDIAKDYEGDGFRRYAISEYIYGKFKYEKMQDRVQATIHLRNARILSIGQSWTAAKYLLYAQKTVFVESCILLYKLLLDDAMEMMRYDAKGAIKICIKAKRRAYDACMHEGEAHALLLQGNCHMLINEIPEAVRCFQKVLAMDMKAKNYEGSCEARIWLIRAYLKLGHWEDSYAHLQILLDFALENDFPYYVGQAYRYMGEYYLNHGNPNLATPLLLKAIDAFHEINDISNQEQVKNFAAVSAGQEVMPKYIKCIVKAGGKGASGWKYLQKLLSWKDLRKNIWLDSDLNLVSGSSFSLESGMELRSYLLGEEEEFYDDGLMGDYTKSTIIGTDSSQIASTATDVTKKSVKIKIDSEKEDSM
nr:uncharacterized protein LOC111420467 isoform X1 [Onthophagus taurus]